MQVKYTLKMIYDFCINIKRLKKQYKIGFYMKEYDKICEKKNAY